MKNKISKIQIGKTYLFLKSGRLVRAVRQDTNSEYGRKYNQLMWEVERIDNGKMLFTSENGLATPEEYDVEVPS